MELSTKTKKSKKKMKKSKEDIIFNCFNYFFFFLITIICAYPFYYLIINSISSNELSALGEVRFLQKELHLENYQQVF